MNPAIVEIRELKAATKSHLRHLSLYLAMSLDRNHPKWKVQRWKLAVRQLVSSGEDILAEV